MASPVSGSTSWYLMEEEPELMTRTEDEDTRSPFVLGDGEEKYEAGAVRWNLVQRSPEEHERIEKRLAEARVHAFANQDDPMMRAQYEVMKRYGGELKPVMLDIDVGVARWRRIIEKLATAQQNDAAAMA